MELQIFNYQAEKEKRAVRTVEIDGEIWFVGLDITKILGIKNSSDAISRLDDEEKRLSVLPTTSGKQKISIISESGLMTT